MIAGNPIISYSSLSRDFDKDLITIHVHSVIITAEKFSSVLGEIVVTELTAVSNCKS